MRIVFASQYFWPEVLSPQHIYENARGLAGRGHEVTILTAFPNRPSGVIPERYKGKFFLTERNNGLRFVRTYVYAAPTKRLFRRLLGEVSFALSSLLGGFAIGRCDAIISISPPFTNALSSCILSRMKRAPFIFWLNDLHPETAIQLGVLRNRFLIRMLTFLELFLYRKAEKVVVATKGIGENIIGRGVPRAKVEFIPTGVDTSLFDPSKRRDSIRNELKLEDRFLVLYAGTIGFLQDIVTIIEAARILRDNDQIVFLLVGGGPEKERMAQLSKDYSLENVLFVEIQPRHRLPSFIAAADVVVASLKKWKLFRGALPTKLFEAMAMGVPVICAISGEAEEMIEESGAGVCVEPQNPEEMAKAILRLFGEASTNRSKGEKARDYVEKHYSRSKTVAQVEQMLAGLS
ncbi:MAG: glycosyltransferase family 4 protein [bacterium]